MTIECFDSEMIFFGLHWEEMPSYGKNVLGKQIIVCEKQTMHKRHENETVAYQKIFS